MPEPTHVEISFRSYAKAALLVGALWLFAHLKAFLLVFTVSLMLAGTMAPLARKLVERGIKRPWALVLLLLGMLSCMAAVAFLTAPSVAAQATQFIHDLPGLQRALADRLEAHPITAAMAGSIRNATPGVIAQSLLSGALAYSSQVLVIFGYGVTAIVLALYLLVKPEASQALVYLLVPRGHHVQLARILSCFEVIVGGYLRGQLITSVLMAVVAGLVATAFGLPNALALGVFAGVVDVIPFIGGLIGLALMVLVALNEGAGVVTAIIIIMITYQEIESRIIVPRLYGRALRLPAAVVIVALLIGGELMGIVGALLALPVAAAVRMLIDEMRVELPGDGRTGGSELKAREERAEEEYRVLSEGASPEEASLIASEVAEREHLAATVEETSS